MSNSVGEDPHLRAYVELARSWGVSPSVFAGRERVTRTTYTYAPDGRLMASVSIEDPAWTEEDRELAGQLAEYERGLCSGCHHPMAETMDPGNEFAYRADLPKRCHRCTTTEIANEKAQELPHSSALHIPIVLRER